MVNPQDIGVYAVGGTGVLAAVAFLGRKIWQNLTSATVDSAKASADAAIFTQMRQQLTDLATEIKELKASNKAERQELEHRIDDLEAKIQKLSFRLGHIRRLAIDAYAALTSTKECGKACKNIDDAIVCLKQILDEE